LLGLLASMLCGGELWRTLRHHSFLLLIASVAALVLSCEWGQLSAPRGLHWLARMGRLSYELYLTHVFVVLAALALYRWGMGDDAYWTALVYPPAIMLCVWLAAQVERHLSQPCERALRSRLGGA
jgi:peptidoglycan/LPS O-acetylase OafA/YrhL